MKIINKTILALLASTMIASSAGAQTTVTIPSMTIYGNIDAAVQKYDAGSNSLMRASDGNFTPSRLGFKGSSPDLGGLKLNYQLEAGLRANSGTMGSTTTTGQAFTREAWVGISGSAGEVRLGTMDISDAGEIDTLAFQFGSFSNIPVNGAALELGTDASNVAKYISPVFSGIQLQAGYAGNSNGATTDANSDTRSGSLTYSVGNAKFGAGYAAKEAATSVGETDAKSLGAAYDFGAFSVGTAYVFGDNSTTADVKSTANVFSVKVPLDKNGLAVHGVYAMSKDGAQTTANQGTGYTVGMTKTFAPGALVYAGYSKVTNEANSTMFLTNMTQPAAGKDPSLMTVGINYAF